MLRTALSVGVPLAGLTWQSRDAQAAYAHPGNFWERRAMTNGNGGCRVPYSLETDTDDVRNTVMDVINYLNIVSPCVWEPKLWWEGYYVAITENDWNYHWFTDLASSSGGIGKTWEGRQEMKICHGCNDFRMILHEMGHSMGLFHEHQRPDRDLFVDVHLSLVTSESRDSFDINWDGTTLGTPYDVRSVMHYDGWAFMDPASAPGCWITGCRTLKIRDFPEGELGSTYFTDSDLKALDRRYPIPKRLTAMNSGKCVDIPGGLALEQTAVQQSDCHTGTNQGWLLRWAESVDGTDYYLIESADPAGAGLCLDVQWASQDPGTPVFLWPCGSYGAASHSQQWSLVPVGASGTLFNNGYTIRARHSGQCLDVAWNSQDNGAAIVQSTCTRTENQYWGQNYRPEFVAPERYCRLGQPQNCQYEIDSRRIVCDCLAPP